MVQHDLLSPFVPNATFLYPLKTSENRKVFWYFQGVEKECIGNEWVNLQKESLHKLSRAPGALSTILTNAFSAGPKDEFELLVTKNN